ncbi:MAG: ABC transporter substrate-binding protein [Janthinobacterium lividum]
MNKSPQTNDIRNIFWAKLSFIFIFLLTLIFFISLKPRIMVIYSSHKDDPRVQEMNAGVQYFFAKNNQASIIYQYLDTQSNLSEIYKLKIGILARQIIDRVNPNLMILCDPLAQELVGRNYVNTSDKDIVFCGVKDNPQDYGYNEAHNVTGVFDIFPLNAVKEVASLMSIKPVSIENPVKIILLGDNSEKSKKLKQILTTYDWTPHRLIDLITVNTFEDWKSAIATSGERADLVIVAGYERIFVDDNLTILKNSRDLIQWTLNNTSLPIIGTSISFFKNGGDMSIVSSPFSQGEEAAKLASQIINGKNAKDFPYLKPHDYQIYVNESSKNNQINRLPSVYKTFSHALTSLRTK